MDNAVVIQNTTGVIILDRSGHIHAANQRAESLLRRPAGSMEGQHIATLMPQEFVSRFRPGITTRVKFKAPQGSLMATYYPMSHRDISGVVCIREAHGEQDLQEEVAFLREGMRDLEGIFDSAPDEIYVTDGDGTTLRVNSACERLYGMPAQSLIGRNVRDLEAQGIFVPSVTRAVLESNSKVTLVQETNTGRKIMAVANPIFDEDGHIVRIVTLSRDITEFYELKKTLSEKEDLIRRYLAEVTTLRKESTHVEDLVIKSPAMLKILETIQRAASFDSTVLLLGESGTGKDTFAKMIHRFSPRNAGPFIKINCGAVPEPLMESEFFGYVSGAFTGAQRGGKKGIVEMANHGTLFLNEVDSLPLALQVKVLHLIQERQFMQVGGTKPTTVDIRIIAASNRPLDRLVKESRFREDLYYRLNVVPITIPPLRERREEIPLLSAFFVDRLCKKYGVEKRLSAEAMDLLAAFSWPGNVRELENIVERCIVTSSGPDILPEHLPEQIRENASAGRATSQAPGVDKTGVNSLRDLERIERDLLHKTLLKCGSTRKAAASLGISQSTVVRRMRRFGLHPIRE